jgi:hypothetical protein
VVIPNSVEIIGERCFDGCRSLNEVVFEEGSNLTRIDGRAFSFSGLESIRIPSKVEIIGESCFYGCEDLHEVIFEGGFNLREIGPAIFEGCSNLKRITVYSGMNELGFEALRNRGVRVIAETTENRQ